MDDAADVNKVVAAIFAASMCSAKENKHENYLAEYELSYPGWRRATLKPGKLLRGERAASLKSPFVSKQSAVRSWGRRESPLVAPLAEKQDDASRPRTR